MSLAASSASRSSFLWLRHPVQDGAGLEALGVEVEVLADQGHQPLLVGGVVDREVRLVAELVDLLAQDPHAGRVEGRDPHDPGPLADQLLDALLHLGRGLVGEGDREDRAGVRAALAEISQAIRRVSTRVLPEPAPATTSSGAPSWTTAARWGSLRPSSSSSREGPRRAVRGSSVAERCSRPGIGKGVLISRPSLRATTPRRRGTPPGSAARVAQVARARRTADTGRMTHHLELLIVGDGPVAEAVRSIAATLDWGVTTALTSKECTAALASADAVVVVSHHEGIDAPAIRDALRADSTYVGAMGSRKTQARRREWLLADGVTDEELASTACSDRARHRRRRARGDRRGDPRRDHRRTPRGHRERGRPRLAQRAEWADPSRTGARRGPLPGRLIGPIRSVRGSAPNLRRGPRTRRRQPPCWRRSGRAARTTAPTGSAPCGRWP